ncbi:MAG: hypothetical protein M1381_09305 [Deltaproteobacteria bacterium]|nr:hypothetical protein [Deltaproteobacteria bacterium]
MERKFIFEGLNGGFQLNDVALAVGSDDGKVYAFSTLGGSGLTMLTTTGAIKSSIAFTSQYFAVGDDNGMVFGGKFITPQPCAASTAADPTQTSELDNMRAFRDRTMGQGKEGKWLIDTYYQYTSEVTGIIAMHSDIRQQAQTLLGEALTVITAYQKNNDTDELNEQLTQEQADQLYEFAENIKALTNDQSLKDALTKWEQDDLNHWQGMTYRQIIQEMER